MSMDWNALMPIVGMASTFTFLSIFWWALQRRREREAYYRYTLARQMLEQKTVPDTTVLDWVREMETAEQKRRRDGTLLGALVTFLAGGASLIPFALEREESIPSFLCVGVGLALFVYLIITRRRVTPTAR